MKYWLCIIFCSIVFITPRYLVYGAETLTTVQENSLQLGMRKWGTGTIVTGNGGTGSIVGEDAILQTNGPTGFAYIDLNINSIVPINRNICISVGIQSAGDAFVNNNIILSGTYTSVGGKTSAKISKPTVPGDRFGIRFVLSSQGGVALRIGIDVLQTGTEGSNRTLIIRRPVLEVIDPLTPSKQCYNEGIPAHSASVKSYRADTSYHEPSNDRGIITFTKIYTRKIPSYAYGVIIGDSISISYLSPTGWPNILSRAHPEYAFWLLAKGGLPLTNIASWINEELDHPSETDVMDIYPSFAIIQGGINDVVMGSYEKLSLQNMIISMETIIRALIAHNIQKIVFINIHPFGGHVNYTLGRGDDETILRYNAWLKSYADDNYYGYVDAYTLLKDSTDPRLLNAAYSIGDGLHLNAIGSDIIANSVEHILAELLNK